MLREHITNKQQARQRVMEPSQEVNTTKYTCGKYYKIKQGNWASFGFVVHGDASHLHF